MIYCTSCLEKWGIARKERVGFPLVAVSRVSWMKQGKIFCKFVSKKIVRPCGEGFCCQKSVKQKVLKIRSRRCADVSCLFSRSPKAEKNCASKILGWHNALPTSRSALNRMTWGLLSRRSLCWKSAKTFWEGTFCGLPPFRYCAKRSLYWKNSISDTQWRYSGMKRKCWAKRGEDLRHAGCQLDKERINRWTYHNMTDPDRHDLRMIS